MRLAVRDGVLVTSGGGPNKTNWGSSRGARLRSESMMVRLIVLMLPTVKMRILILRDKTREWM